MDALRPLWDAERPGLHSHAERGNDLFDNGLKFRCPLFKEAPYVKSLLALLSLVALPVLAAEPTLYGRYEYIALPEIGGEVLKAKMDTGALTASLSAKDIETFTRDGDEWVRFRLATKGASNKVYEHKVARISKIKTRSEEDEDDKDAIEPTKRPVVDLELCLGNVKRTVEVNLTDRSSFNYPLLIGAKALREFGAAVNPARRFTADKPDC
ncbi:hypothetical protein ABH904_004390 [Pseudomonas frederiksbergensis]